MKDSIQDIRTTVEETKEELCEQWDADEATVRNSGFGLSWDNEVDQVVDNVHAMVEEMRSLSNQNPDAEVNGNADAEGFSVSLWFTEEEDD